VSSSRASSATNLETLYHGDAPCALYPSDNNVLSSGGISTVAFVGKTQTRLKGLERPLKGHRMLASLSCG
jgi:hypothetical protein